MTDTNQKLRDVLNAAQQTGCAHNNGAGGQYLICATEAQLLAFAKALALPTAAQVDDINVAELFTSVTKTAAPVDERELPPSCVEDTERGIRLVGPHGGLKESLPNPTEIDLADPIFEAIWQAIKTWDVNSPEHYVGYCGANGSHVMLILNAIRASLQSANHLPALKQLSADYEKLQADNQALQDSLNAAEASVRESTVTIGLLRAQVASLQSGADAKDAARYRTLRRGHGQQWSVINGIGDVLRGEELDSHVDAAIAKRGA